MAKTFTDNAGKGIVRTNWNTPLLSHLHKKLGVRFRYCGLPGPEILDLLLWREMLEEVVAFEPPDDSPDGTKAISELRFNLHKYKIPGRVFLGPFRAPTGRIGDEDAVDRPVRDR